VSPSETRSVIQLLGAVRAGVPGSLERLFPVVYDELRRLAETVRRGRAGETLSATALVHEAYVKLAASPELAVQDRAHFCRVAARAMRQVLADAARHRSAGKRGGGESLVTLDDPVAVKPSLTPDELHDLDRALTALGERSSRQLTVVECHLFAGLTLEETAAAVGVSVPTVVRDLRFARAWLSNQLRDVAPEVRSELPAPPEPRHARDPRRG
jgi:RNA polymerase sigma factor (TIGR02999 family)